MKKNILKLTKLFTSRILYLFIGIFVAIAIFTAQAGNWWQDSPPDGLHLSGSTVLTAELWNTLVAKAREVEVNALKIVRGFVQENGDPIAPVGFTSKWDGDNSYYVINFSSPFSKAPSVIAQTDTDEEVITVGFVTANNFTIVCKKNDSSSRTKCPFHFLAIK